MKILTLNLRHGGGTRIDALADYLLGQNADVVVATEYRSGKAGKRIRERLEGAGFRLMSAPTASPTINSVLICSRMNARRIRLELSPADAHRVVAAEISGMKVAGVYFASQKEKASLFDFILSKPPALSSETLIIGDFNTGLHRLDEAGATFVCTDRFERLPEIGLSDLWRRSHGPNAREYTWTSPRGGHFRLDHAFASPGVTARVRSCVYDHATRPALTDHSAMIVELDWE